MKNIRIIPRLDIKGSNVVKPVQADALRIVGSPHELAQRYYRDGADELLYLDIVASLYGRSIDLNLLRSVTENIFIPMTVGGGVQSVQNARNILRFGADKIAVNTYAIRRPALIRELADEFGSQCVVLSIEAKRQPGNWWEAYTDGGREHSGRNVIDWVQEALTLGAGEILLTSIDADGRRVGYDVELLQQVAAVARIPIIIYGGAQSPQSLYEAIENGADAVAAATIFHYNEYSIHETKGYLQEKGVSIRTL